jgi:SAM-dependent methyltransferase
VAHDLYSRPPGPADSGALTRRALLRLRPPGLDRNHGAADAARAALAGLGMHRDEGALREIFATVAGVIAEVAGVGPRARVLEARSIADLDRPPASFDLVAAPFGLALDPEPDRVVRALARVGTPGGVVALTAWVPRGLPGRLFEFAEQLNPPPPGVPSPSEWGRSDVAARRLAETLVDVQVRTRTIRLSFQDATAAFATLSSAVPFPEARRDELRPAFDRLLSSCNDALQGVEIAGRYLLALGRIS